MNLELWIIPVVSRMLWWLLPKINTPKLLASPVSRALAKRIPELATVLVHGFIHGAAVDVPGPVRQIESGYDLAKGFDTPVFGRTPEDGGLVEGAHVGGVDAPAPEGVDHRDPVAAVVVAHQVVVGGDQARRYSPKVRSTGGT